MFKAPFSFEGRIRRLEYGLSYLIYILLFIIGGLFWQEFDQIGVFSFLFYVVFIWFIMAQRAKRCHDLGNSGFYQLIPFYGLLLIFQDGELVENKYGVNPKEKLSEIIKSDSDDSLLKVIVEVSSAVLLNTFFVAILMEYLNTSGIMLFLWVVLSVILCYFLMLLIKFRGRALPDNRKIVLRLPIVYSTALYICIRLYTLYFRDVGVDIYTIYLELFMVALLLAFTFIPFVGYKMFFKNKLENNEN